LKPDFKLAKPSWMRHKRAARSTASPVGGFAIATLARALKDKLNQ